MGRRYAKPGRVLHDLGPAALFWGSVHLLREFVGQSRRHGRPHDNGLLFESRLHSVLPPCRRSLLEPLLDSAKPDLLRAIRQWPIQRILRRRSRLPEHYGLNRFSAERAGSRPWVRLQSPAAETFRWHISSWACQSCLPIGRLPAGIMLF